MNKAVVAISTDFLSAFAELPRQIQGKVTEFINKFRNNPKSQGINYEKLHEAADKKIYSVRIDDTYRGIVARQEENDVYLLLWVDHHDKAYAWAKRKKCEINPTTGNIQVFDLQEEEPSAPPPAAGLFSDIPANDMLRLGIPKDQLNIIRAIKNTEDFYQKKSVIPEDAYEALEWLANGFPLTEVFDLLSDSREKVSESDFAAALQNPRSQKAFVVIEGEDELRNIMAEPLEKWRVFLHPTQRKIVQKNYAGAARVLGGAGTGKTVVAMHRAKWLTEQLNRNERILFTTFTTNLAGDIKENLRKICSIEEMKRIDVINLDAWVSQFLREQEYSYTIVYDDETEEVWKEAVILSGEDLDLTTSFFSEEWSKVVNTQEAFSQELYMKAPRIGRGIRLDRKKRMQIWHVFEEYQNIMKDRRQRDVETAMYECRIILEKTKENTPYASVVVDEGQDLSASAFRLLRALAGAEHPNDMFIVGDSHQRIYKNKAVLSKCGINIRGRSNYLKINYRTTEEIRKYAFSILKNISFDDLDEEYDDGKACQSLTHGVLPIVRNFKGAAEEFDYIIGQLEDLEAQGVSLRNICIVARTHKLLDNYTAQLTQSGIRTYEIKNNKLDDHTFEGVRVATMHRVKGLEFQHVFIVAVNNKIVPLSSAVNHNDPVSETETITAERCLLYVALTRAQKSAYICSYGTPSEFLKFS